MTRQIILCMGAILGMLSEQGCGSVDHDSTGTSADAAPEVTVCEDGQAICSGACVTIASDDANCGGCGLACTGAQSCSGGRCVAPVCAPGTRLSDDASTCQACTAPASLAPVSFWRLGETSITAPAADDGTATTPAPGVYLGVAADTVLGAASAAWDGDAAMALTRNTVDAGMIVASYANMPTGALTVTMWVKIDPLATDDDYTPFSYATASYSNAFTLFRPVSSSPLDSAMRVHIGSAEINTNNLIVLDTGNWTFVAITWDPATKTVQVYVDAIKKLETVAAAPDNAITAGGRLYLGQEQDGLSTGAPGLSAPQSLVGSMDDVAIFDRILTADELRALYLDHGCQ